MAWSARRGFATQARKQGVQKEDIDLQCAWRMEENTKGREVHKEMANLYAETSEMEEVLVGPTKAL